MQTQSSRVTLGDVWEEIITPKKMTNRNTSTDEVTARIIKNKNGSTRITFAIGHDVLDILGWKERDEILWFRHKLNGTLFRLMKGHGGYTLSRSNKACKKLQVSMTIPHEKKYILALTINVVFDIDKNGIVFDLAPLIKQD